MNKYVLSALLTVGLSISAFAVQSVPVAASDKQMVDSKFAGVSTCEISNATGTAQLGCTSGSGIILDIVASSVAATDAIVIRDVSTASVTGTVLYTIDKNSLDKANRVFPRFKNGLDVNVLVAPTGAGGSAAAPTSRPSWIIVYNKDLY